MTANDTRTLVIEKEMPFTCPRKSGELSRKVRSSNSG